MFLLTLTAYTVECFHADLRSL